MDIRRCGQRRWSSNWRS